MCKNIIIMINARIDLNFFCNRDNNNIYLAKIDKVFYHAREFAVACIQNASKL